MNYGGKTIEWQIARRLVKWWVRRLIRKHIEFRDRTEHNRSNQNYAKLEFNIARISYWRKSFRPWGDWCLYGCRAFSFSDPDYEKKIDRELREIGFEQRLKWKETGG